MLCRVCKDAAIGPRDCGLLDSRSSNVLFLEIVSTGNLASAISGANQHSCVNIDTAHDFSGDVIRISNKR